MRQESPSDQVLSQQFKAEIEKEALISKTEVGQDQAQSVDKQNVIETQKQQKGKS